MLGLDDVVFYAQLHLAADCQRVLATERGAVELPPYVALVGFADLDGAGRVRDSAVVREQAPPLAATFCDRLATTFCAVDHLGAIAADGFVSFALDSPLVGHDTVELRADARGRGPRWLETIALRHDAVEPAPGGSTATLPCRRIVLRAPAT